MAIEKNIGKNTIGDNEKMKVYMHDYNMSTHDLSTITRTSISPGVLVPTMKLLVQKGDTIDIDIESNVLTHPTTGPLFGSFKLENHIYLPCACISATARCLVVRFSALCFICDNVL